MCIHDETRFPGGTLCDYCLGTIPLTSTNIMTAVFRIESAGKHRFTVHKSCAVDMIREICALEL
jgi:hypothetical protein